MSPSSRSEEPRSRPRIAVVLSGYGAVERGAEIMLAQLLPRLTSDFDLDVFSRSGAGPGGIRRLSIPRQLLDGPYSRWRLLRKALDTLFLDPLHVEWTTHLLTSLPALVRGRYDVIWHETGLWGGYLMAMVRRLTGARLLDIAHASHPGWEVPFARRRPDAYVVPTRAFGAFMADRVPGLAVEVIPQGVDCSLFTPTADPWPLTVAPPVVLAVGALSPEKRPALLVEAAAEAGVSLVLAGEGPLAPTLDLQAARVLPPDRYQRLSLRRSLMPRLYAAADVVALASPREALSFALLEALACDKAVVSTDDAIRREVVGGAGILVAGDHPADWGRALADAAGRDWSGRPRRQALSFDLEETARRYRALLARLAGDRR